MVETLVRSQHVRVERIVSTGQCSPDGFWYDQDEHEWVWVVKGSAKLLFDDGEMVQMNPGDHVLITAQRKHRVQWTTPDEPTVCLGLPSGRLPVVCSRSACTSGFGGKYGF